MDESKLDIDELDRLLDATEGHLLKGSKEVIAWVFAIHNAAPELFAAVREMERVREAMEGKKPPGISYLAFLVSACAERDAAATDRDVLRITCDAYIEDVEELTAERDAANARADKAEAEVRDSIKRYGTLSAGMAGERTAAEERIAELEATVAHQAELLS